MARTLCPFAGTSDPVHPPLTYVSSPTCRFSEADLEFWATNGYVVLHNAVPQENLQAVIDDVWQFFGMDPSDEDTWYHDASALVPEGGRPPHGPGGMVELYQSQSLWDNRQHPRVHAAFAQIWGTEKLWCSMDRANMKPPVRESEPEWQHPGMIHWDADTTSGKGSFRVQGVLYLADTPANGGGFRASSSTLDFPSI